MDEYTVAAQNSLEFVWTKQKPLTRVHYDLKENIGNFKVLWSPVGTHEDQIGAHSALKVVNQWENPSQHPHTHLQCLN